MSARAPLFLPLRRQYFQAFKDGTKTVEYRLYGKRWNEKLCTLGRAVWLSNGYGAADRMDGVITSFWTTDRPPPEWVAIYGEPAGRLAACIEIKVTR